MPRRSSTPITLDHAEVPAQEVRRTAPRARASDAATVPTRRRPSAVRAAPRADRRAVAATAWARPDSLQVAKRAFLFFLERGAKHGHDVEDWLRAERELTAEMDRGQ